METLRPPALYERAGRAVANEQDHGDQWTRNTIRETVPVRDKVLYRARKQVALPGWDSKTIGSLATPCPAFSPSVDGEWGRYRENGKTIHKS